MRDASILTAIYHMLKDGTMHQDLGPNHFDACNKERQKNRALPCDHIDADGSLDGPGRGAPMARWDQRPFCGCSDPADLGVARSCAGAFAISVSVFSLSARRAVSALPPWRRSLFCIEKRGPTAKGFEHTKAGAPPAARPVVVCRLPTSRLKHGSSQLLYLTRLAHSRRLGSRLRPMFIHARVR